MKKGGPIWLPWLQHCPDGKRPAVIIETWSSAEATDPNGAFSKVHRKRMSQYGYSQCSRQVELTSVGSAVDQTRLVIVYSRLSSPIAARLNLDLSKGAMPGIVARSMENLLRPVGLVPSRAYEKAGSSRSDVEEADIPVAHCSPMPSSVGRLIRDAKGVRRLQADELARGLGIPATWGDLEQTPGNFLNSLPGIHLWEWLGYCFFQSNSSETAGPVPPQDSSGLDAAVPSPVFQSEKGTWAWEACDLRPGSPWMLERVDRLAIACRGLPDRLRHFREGLASLDIHRENYGPSGAKQLRLLWWEFPSERWHELREGCSMNFLEPPAAGVTPNAPMELAELRAAEEFVDELVDLQVLTPPPPGVTVKCTAPLFVVPKPGQADQWRVISDMKRGKQNQSIGKDPVFLRRPSHVLEQLYAGGYTAVGDASKMFYQFPTRADEQEYLGLLHPRTGALLVWTGLPMGSASSPGIAGRMGSSFIRLLKLRFPDLFGGVAHENTWRQVFAQEGNYDARLGHGLVRMCSDGLPPVLLLRSTTGASQVTLWLTFSTRCILIAAVPAAMLLSSVPVASGKPVLRK
jgi:hypothetical protein